MLPSSETGQGRGGVLPMLWVEGSCGMTAVLRLLATLKPNSGWAALPLLDCTGLEACCGEHRGAGGAEGRAGGDLCGAGVG